MGFWSWAWTVTLILVFLTLLFGVLWATVLGSHGLTMPFPTFPTAFVHFSG